MKEFDNGLANKWEFELDVPVDSEVDVGKLKGFLKRDDTLIFYGGEPLLQVDKIRKIMDNVACRFYMQTNGKLLDKLESEYLNRISKILVSIDGSREVTDFNKGVGTYDKVLENVRLIRENGFAGEIVARMVISSEFSDVYEQVLHLSNLDLFDSVHWQIDAGFYKNDFDEEKFSKFVEEYNKSISKLIDFWVDEMKNGRVLRFYPFVGIMDSILKNEKTRLRCGAGYANYTITTNGNLVACPIMGCVKDFYCGNLDSKEFKVIGVMEPCGKCSYLDVCGGRCLYSNCAKLWPEQGEELICKTIKFLVDCLREKADEVRELIDENIISEKDFFYEKYFGPEIIP